MSPRFESIGVKIKLTETLKNKIAEVGYDPKFGARPLKRVLQKYVEDTVAETMISNKINPGDTITLDFDSKKENTTSTPVKVKISTKKQKPTE
jgi:ATP-dependent Clp protease ATP-binding subunit ClpC